MYVANATVLNPMFDTNGHILFSNKNTIDKISYL